MSVAAAIGAGIVGYLIGSLPTAEWLGKRAAVDLRREGSTNPGTNNALRLAGPRLAAAVLTTEMAKGVIAVVAGVALAGDIGAVLAGVGAVTGNVFNSYYRFRGGKGLGISAGVLTAIWPTVVLPVLAVLGDHGSHHPILRCSNDRHHCRLQHHGDTLDLPRVADGLGDSRHHSASGAVTRNRSHSVEQTLDRLTVQPTTPSFTSRTSVTGPSFVSSTSIIAPKTPWAVTISRSRNEWIIRSISGPACSGRAASVNDGRRPRFTSPARVN